MRLVSVALLASAALALAGCTSTPAPTPTSSTEAPTPTPTATVVPDPVLVPTGGPLENLPYFDFINKRTVSQNGSAGGRDFIDALTAAGFDRLRMEVTADRTAVDLQADSIQFSIRFDDGCLIGQYGAVTGYLSVARGLLSTGRCLIGETRPIDW